jgi:uncharacterized protein YoxC
MNELTGNITFWTIVIISLIIFVAVAVFVMFALLCANVAQIKKTLRQVRDELGKKKGQVSVDYLRPKT